jgi:hypothetical protein
MTGGAWVGRFILFSIREIELVLRSDRAERLLLHTRRHRSGNELMPPSHPTTCGYNLLQTKSHGGGNGPPDASPGSGICDGVTAERSAITGCAASMDRALAGWGRDKPGPLAAARRQK